MRRFQLQQERRFNAPFQDTKERMAALIPAFGLFLADDATMMAVSV
jgi:hypothetical protein